MSGDNPTPRANKKINSNNEITAIFPSERDAVRFDDRVFEFPSLLIDAVRFDDRVSEFSSLFLLYVFIAGAFPSASMIGVGVRRIGL